MVNWEEFGTKHTLVGLGLGQFLSLLVTSTGFSSSELSRRGKMYYYVLLGLVDVEANFLVVKAYQYTSITSVMLLDCWTIPCVLFLTWFFLKTRYRFQKLVGVVICIAGLVVVVFSDVHSADRTGNNSLRVKTTLFDCGKLEVATLLKVICLLLLATLYGVSNVSEEYFVKSADRVELMAFLGIFGALISACQISILERDELRSIHWTAGAALPFIGFSVAMFLFYSGVPVLLKISGSTMLNLSLLTSDMWAVLIRIFAYHEKVDWMYFVAFAAVAVGLVVYSGGDKTEQNTAEVADEEAVTSNRDVASTSVAQKDGTETSTKS
ncbi:Solute carrier family 35 member F1 [Sesamum angolense]|uniref:Solute carrier family 35 member F1 n=1 Tax=Sesamum angolense TaxID=2727404 RepID=A0AAE1X389_9LAMI|nr:Solute carrier family 35 member F1 [Sesamum angolense]